MPTTLTSSTRVLTTRATRRGAGVLAAVAVAVGVLAGCSAGSTPAPAPTPAPASSSAPVEASPTPTTAGCPDGAYALTGLEGQGVASTLGTGTGGNVVMTFTGGTWTLSSDGGQPVALDVGPTTAELTITGTITGGYETETSGTQTQIGLAVSDATGTATIKGFGVSREASMRQVADRLLPGGTSGTVTCTGEQADLVLPNVVLALTRT